MLLIATSNIANAYIIERCDNCLYNTYKYRASLHTPISDTIEVIVYDLPRNKVHNFEVFCIRNNPFSIPENGLHTGEETLFSASELNTSSSNELSNLKVRRSCVGSTVVTELPLPAGVKDEFSAARHVWSRLNSKDEYYFDAENRGWSSGVRGLLSNIAQQQRMAHLLETSYVVGTWRVLQAVSSRFFNMTGRGFTAVVEYNDGSRSYFTFNQSNGKFEYSHSETEEGYKIPERYNGMNPSNYVGSSYNFRSDTSYQNFLYGLTMSGWWSSETNPIPNGNVTIGTITILGPDGRIRKLPLKKP